MRPLATFLLIALTGCPADTCDAPCPDGSVCVAARCRTACTTVGDCGEDEVCFRGYCEVGDLRPDLVDGNDPGDAIAGDAIAGDAIAGDANAGDAIAGDAIAGDSTPVCGNNNIEIGETCDGTDLDGQSNCASFRYQSGPAACMETCKEFDLSACVNPTGACGDGVRHAQQQCDTTDLGEQSCESLGFSSGDLACHDNCSFDITGCIP